MEAGSRPTCSGALNLMNKRYTVPCSVGTEYINPNPLCLRLAASAGIDRHWRAMTSRTLFDVALPSAGLSEARSRRAKLLCGQFVTERPNAQIGPGPRPAFSGQETVAASQVPIRRPFRFPCFVPGSPPPPRGSLVIRLNFRGFFMVDWRNQGRHLLPPPGGHHDLTGDRVGDGRSGTTRHIGTWSSWNASGFQQFLISSCNATTSM